MSNNDLLFRNNYDLQCGSLTTSNIIAKAQDGDKRLQIGFDFSTTSVHIGTNVPGNTPVYIDEVLINPAVIGGYIVGAPIAPVDGNGIVLTGPLIELEYADDTHPGIVSTVAQVFSGDKTFDSIALSATTVPAGGSGLLLNYSFAYIATGFTQNAVEFPCTLGIQRVGNMCTIDFTTLAHQMTNGGLFVSDIQLPTDYRPSILRNFVCQGRNNSNWQFCSGQVDINGVISVGTSMTDLGVLIDFAMGDNALFDSTFSYVI